MIKQLKNIKDKIVQVSTTYNLYPAFRNLNILLVLILILLLDTQYLKSNNFIELSFINVLLLVYIGIQLIIHVKLNMDFIEWLGTIILVLFNGLLIYLICVYLIVHYPGLIMFYIMIFLVQSFIMFYLSLL